MINLLKYKRQIAQSSQFNMKFNIPVRMLEQPGGKRGGAVVGEASCLRRTGGERSSSYIETPPRGKRKWEGAAKG